MSVLLEHDAPSTEPTFRVQRRFVTVGGVRRTVRLVRFASGWLASADSPEGPTLGADHSPYLAVRRALEPLGVDLVTAIGIVGTV